VGVGAVIVQDGHVVLVRRKYEPLAGRWSLPGGIVEVGETLERTVTREMAEETGLEVEVGPVVEVFERIMHDDQGLVRYHYVLVDYLCWPVGGVLCAGSDVDDTALVALADLARYDLTTKALDVIARAVELAADPRVTGGGSPAAPPREGAPQRPRRQGPRSE
jgi:mutator protein MutT